MAGSAYIQLRRMPLVSTLTIVITCVVLYSALVYALIKQEARRDMEALVQSETTKLELAVTRMEHSFVSVSNNLRATVNTPALIRFRENPSAENKQALAEHFKKLLGERTIFQQVRFIDSAGFERVRAERDNDEVTITPAERLQYKGGRYYVKQSLELGENDIYVSPLDLDVENGAVVVPFRPVMRFVIGIFNEQDQRQGLLVFNMRGQPLLDILADTPAQRNLSFLLNNEGHVLSGPDNTHQWGFMFGLPAEFANRYPTAWKLIGSEHQGYTLTAAGLFVFKTVNPLTYIQLRPWEPLEHHQLMRNSYWKAVSCTPRNQLPSVAVFFKPTTLVAYLAGLVLLVSSVLALLASSHKRQLLRQQVERQAKRFRRIASALGEGLMVLNRSGEITYANPEAESLLGWENNELVRRNCQDVFSADPAATEPCPIMGVLQSGDVYRSHQHFFLRKDGHSIPVDLNAAPLYSDSGEEGVVVSFRDFSTIKQYQEEIHQLAYHDALTGLPNRLVLEDRLNQALSFAGRYDQSVALLFLDLDHFKHVNDAFGHATGDALLKQIADTLVNCVRDTDTVVRMGGDEFIVLLPELKHQEDAYMVARKILNALSYPMIIDDEEMGVGVSIGIAVNRGGDISAEQLLQRADKAMYDAKHAGRNTYVIAAGARQAPAAQDGL